MLRSTTANVANYFERGYLNAEVKATVTRHPENPRRVGVTYEITERQIVRVSDVVYLGQKHTELSLIGKTANLHPETPMERGRLLAAESRLYDLNIFDWSSVGPRKPIADQTDEEALVKVHEAKRNEIIYGFGFEVSHRGGNIPSGTIAVPGGPPVGLGSNQIAPSQAVFASPLGSIDFTRRNMRGLGESVSASLLLSRLDQRALTTYLQPHFLGSSWSSLSSFSIERTTENPLFAAGLGDLSFQVEKLLSRKTNTRLQLRYDFNKTDLSHLLVPELVLPQDRNIHLSTVSSTLIRDTRDKPLDAHRGVFATVDFRITPTALGSSATFAKLFGQYSYYKPFHSLVFANSVRLGLAKAFAGSAQTEPLDAELYGLRTEVRFDLLAKRYHGSISYDNGRFRYADSAPLQHSLDATFNATPSRLSLESVALKVGSSALLLHADLTNYGNPSVQGSYDLHIHTFGGSVSYRPALQFNLTMQGESIRLLYPDGLRTLLDGNLVLSGTKEASTLIGTAANPVIIGRADLTSGELFYRNVRYQLERGVITFDNPNQTEPMMNVSASTNVEQYNLTLTLRGTFDKLITSYTSDPPLATADIIKPRAESVPEIYIKWSSTTAPPLLGTSGS
jgi:hypothetical protein